MVDEDIERLCEALQRSLAFALDGSGERARLLRLREGKEAVFYGITIWWQDGLRKLDQEGRELLVELAVATPSVATAMPDLEEPLREAEQALSQLLTAIVEVEIEDQPASALWEQERDETIAQLDRMKSGEAKSANCTICGIPNFEGPDRLREHFELHHWRPGPSARRLVPTDQQVAAVEAASKAYRAAYEEAISGLTAYREARASGEVEPAVGGRTPHAWRDIMIVMARQRIRDGVAGSPGEEATWLLEWAQSLKLPLDPGKKPPSRRTIADWVRRERAKADVKPSA